MQYLLEKVVLKVHFLQLRVFGYDFVKNVKKPTPIGAKIYHKPFPYRYLQCCNASSLHFFSKQGLLRDTFVEIQNIEEPLPL